MVKRKNSGCIKENNSFVNIKMNLSLSGLTHIKAKIFIIKDKESVRFAFVICQKLAQLVIMKHAKVNETCLILPVFNFTSLHTSIVSLSF